MATNHPVIPPIADQEHISDWCILFEASTEQIRGQDDGEKRVTQMLPAYVNRSYADRECVDFKFAASLVASQLPRDVESKIKATVVSAEGDLESAASRKLLTDIKRELIDRGHALDKGNIELERIVKVAAVSDQVRNDALESDKEEEPPTLA